MGMQLKDGKFVATAGATKSEVVRPPKYPWPSKQYATLLAIAKADGLDVGETQAKQTHAINSIASLIIDDFISRRDKK